MTHAEILKLLTPVPLGPGYDKHLAAQGAALDRAKTAAEQALQEILPDLTVEKLSDWERLLALNPASDATLSARRQAVLLHFRMRGSLSRAYFITLAAAYEQTITITEYVPSMCGRFRCGEVLCEESTQWIWTVSGLSNAPQAFRCGQACCGEPLGSSPNSLEAIITRLKPAHTLVYFIYNG